MEMYAEANGLYRRAVVYPELGTSGRFKLRKNRQFIVVNSKHGKGTVANCQEH